MRSYWIGMDLSPLTNDELAFWEEECLTQMAECETRGETQALRKWDNEWERCERLLDDRAQRRNPIIEARIRRAFDTD